MLEQMQHVRNRLTASAAQEAQDESPPSSGFGPLQVLTANLLLVTGIGATLDSLSRSRSGPGGIQADRPLDHEGYTPALGSFATAWAPSLLAPLAAAAHLRHTRSPSANTSAATRLLDAAVIGAGVAGLAEALASLRRGGTVSLTPVALAASGVLGLMLERQERISARERERLERRASLVERLVPKRRPRLDRVVVHV